MSDPSDAYIRLTTKTKGDLHRLGAFGDTYEAIVRRILDYYLEAHPDVPRPPVSTSDAVS